MSLNYNKIFIGGRLCETPALKTTASGRETVSVGVAVNRPAKQGEQPEADFFNIVAWDKQAQFLTRYFQKGDPVFVSGRLSVRPWKDRDGNNRTSVEIIAGEINFVESRNLSKQNSELQPSKQHHSMLSSSHLLLWICSEVQNSLIPLQKLTR